MGSISPGCPQAHYPTATSGCGKGTPSQLAGWGESLQQGRHRRRERQWRGGQLRPKLFDEKLMLCHPCHLTSSR
eukprot:5384887-Ditylum_brightwellii.AAC.1